MGTQCLIFSVKLKFSSICELEGYDTVTTRKQSLFIKSEECSNFLFSIHLSIKPTEKFTDK